MTEATPPAASCPARSLHATAIVSKNKLSPFAECRIRTQDFWNRISSRLNARWQTDWAIEDQAKTFNS